jgi:hypothetical protein
VPANICASPIKGTHYRLILLDACGVPVTGASGMVLVSKSFVQVQMEPQYEDGEEFFQRTADGTPCVNEQDAPTLKRMQLTVDLCEINPRGVATAISARVLGTGGPPVTGSGFAVRSGVPGTHFSLEVWQRVSGAGACDPSGIQRYIYNVWPNIGNGRIGTYTIQNGVSQLQYISDSFEPSLLWGRGPATPQSLSAPIQASEHWLWEIVTVPPPAESCTTGVL